jgi:gamma-glutamylcyclotransferase (GGCT)/AIG2-like uncharacterized protein YtfP
MQFFFYGTLQAGSDNPVAQMVHALLEPLGAAQVAGALFAVPDPDGWYPALLPGTDVVHGQLYRAAAGFDAAALDRMDAYEDYRPGDPAGSLYVRGEAALLDRPGTAQVYHFNQPLLAGCLPLPSGDFRAWMAGSDKAAFAGRRAS